MTTHYSLDQGSVSRRTFAQGAVATAVLAAAGLATPALADGTDAVSGASEKIDESLQMTQEELVLAKEISASETTSKIFCHYIKNELLAIEAEIEMLPVAPENRSARNALQQRCNTLYQRIDDLHRNTKTGELRLKKCIMQDILHQALMPYQKNQDTPQPCRL